MPYTANKKINALDLAPIPLGDNDAVPMVRSGVTYQAPLSSVEAKVFSSKTALSAAPLGTEVVIIRQSDGSLRQTTTGNLLPDGAVTNVQIGASAGISDTKLATIATAGKVSNSATTAASLNTPNAIVARDSSGNFAAGMITANLTGNSTGTHTGPLVGNADTATKLATPRAISLVGDVTATGVNFDGSSAISLNTVVSALPDSKLSTISTAGKVANTATTATSANTSSTIVSRDTSGNFSAGTITAALSGNASTASALATPRAISITGDASGSVNFDGGSNVSIPITLGAGSVSNINVSATAAIADTKLATITTAGKVANSATTANSANAANAIVARDASGNFSANVVTANSYQGSGAALTGIASVPCGAVMPFAMTTPPSGWLEANGAAVSRVSYSDLFLAIGTTYGSGDGSNTFNLPDLRGYFVRGAGTNSDGVASGTFGAKQADAFQGHYHTTNAVKAAGPGGAVGNPGGNFGAATVTTPITDGTNGTPRTASETRPRNIAMLYCIKT